MEGKLLYLRENLSSLFCADYPGLLEGDCSCYMSHIGRPQAALVLLDHEDRLSCPLGLLPLMKVCLPMSFSADRTGPGVCVGGGGRSPVGALFLEVSCMPTIVVGHMVVLRGHMVVLRGFASGATTNRATFFSISSVPFLSLLLILIVKNRCSHL